MERQCKEDLGNGAYLVCSRGTRVWKRGCEIWRRKSGVEKGI